jgi:phosphate starvation-inducible PhoH-like protein
LSEIILTIDGVDLLELYGEKNAKLNILRKAYPDVTITSRGNNLKISGEKKLTQNAKSKLELMIRMLKEHKELTTQTVEDLMAGGRPFESRLGVGESNTTIVHGRGGKQIKAKTRNQKQLVDTSESNDIVFAMGPAGTGKTYISVALAVRALRNRIVKRIILTRPAVEAGESLGFLPGDLKDKVDPYLRPLYDALNDMIPAEKLAKFMTERTIEVAPLAFMRGRTLDNAFIILDEAQNTTPLQLKMFLTRRSGLYQALDILTEIDGIGLVRLDAEDVVRHRLVKSIIKAYNTSDEAYRKKREAEKAQRQAEREKEKDSKEEQS